MQRNTKLAVAVVILGTGLVGARCFRKEPPTTRGDTETSPHGLTYRSATASTSASSERSTPGTEQAVADNSSPPWSGTSLRELSSRENPPAAPYGQLPVVPSHYGGPLPSASAPGPPEPAVHAPSPGHNAPSPAPFLTAPANTPSHTPPPQRTHTVVDGDTLPALAQRYLGSSQRYGEIYELNRDWLRHGPDELPIGAVLKIPPRQEAIAAPRSDADEMPDLVPIPPGLFRHHRNAAAQ